MIAEAVLREANDLESEIKENRRWLHSNAETGFYLNKTVAFVKEKLTDMDLEPVLCGKNGITATVGSGNGKTFLLRADMDALPIQEESGVDYCCKNGNMHACGHDMHTAMLLGAAKILKKYQKKINGTIKLVFQPAEEILSGARDMIENGVLEAPRVDCAMMLHVMAGVPFPRSTVIVSSGGVGAPAADYFTVTVQGKGGHGSAPQAGVDALSVAAYIIVALNEISARELGASQKAVLTIGTLKSGTAGNVIADTAVMEGTLRTFNEEVREKVKKRLCEIAEGTALSFRAKAQVSFGSCCPSLLNNGELSASVEAFTKELLGEKNVLNSDSMGENYSGGSEDFAYISREVPSLMLALAAGEPEEGYAYPLHHPKVKFDESVLSTGAAVLAYNAMKWLENN